MSRPRYVRGMRTCSPTDKYTWRPDELISSASWIPVAAAPTTSTARSGNSSGLRYSRGFTDATPSGTAAANAGVLGKLQAPLASTTHLDRHVPSAVTTA